jgi:putative ABC transport system permease protein
VPWRLLFAHLRRSWFRTTLTTAGVALAIFLLATLRTVVTGLQSAVKDSNVQRLIVLSAVGFFKRLPPSFEYELRSTPGIEDVTHWTWFGGVYVDDKNLFSRFATDPESLHRLYGMGPRPDMKMPVEQWDAFASDRRGCIVGTGLVRDFGFKLGDKIEVKGNIFPGQYTFTVRGIYEKGRDQIDDTMLFFHWKYLDETQRELTGRPADVGIYVLGCERGADMAAISREVDDRSASSDHATQTTTEAAFSQMFISMWGNVPLLLSMIGGAVLFAAFMIALNTMLLTGRERRLEIGTLKALGFGDGVVTTLLVAEGTLVAGTGGVVGVLGAHLAFDVNKVPALERFFPAFHILPETMLGCVAVAVVVGLVSGAGPALVAAKTSVVEGLSRRA